MKAIVGGTVVAGARESGQISIEGNYYFPALLDQRRRAQ